MGRRQRVKLLQFVDDLVAQAVSVLSSHGLEEGQARVAGTEIARRICAQYGKTYMYVPTADDWTRNERDREIWEKYSVDGPDNVRRFTRDRVDQLATEYHLSPQQVYNITRLQHHLQMGARQGSLPGVEPAANPR